MESVDWRRFLSERDGQLDTCFPFGDSCICLAADEQDLSDDVLAMMESPHGQPPCGTAVLMLEFVAEIFLVSLRGGQNSMDQLGGMSAEAAAVEAPVYFDVRGALKIETLPGEADVRMVSMLSPSSFSLGADV